MMASKVVMGQLMLNIMVHDGGDVTGDDDVDETDGHGGDDTTNEN